MAKVLHDPVGEREYERPERWEQQIELLRLRCVANSHLLTKYTTPDDASRILGAVAVDLFFKGVRVVDPTR
jgi:hypothetical protein